MQLWEEHKILSKVKVQFNIDFGKKKETFVEEKSLLSQASIEKNLETMGYIISNDKNLSEKDKDDSLAVKSILQNRKYVTQEMKNI